MTEISPTPESSLPPASPIISPRSYTTTIILTLLVLILGAAAGWLGWQFLQRTENQTAALQQQLTTQLQTIEAKNKQVRELEQARWIERNNSLSVAEKQLDEAKLKLQSLAKKQELEQNTSSSKNDYHLLEADYMARLASLNLAFGQNVPAAIALLQTANQRLQDADNPTFNKIRQALANGILNLQAVPIVDTAGLLTQLTALQTQVKRAPLFGLPSSVTSARESTLPEPPTSTDTSLDTTEKRWKRALQESWDTLQKIIIIRHRNQPIAPLIAPEQETYLRQNLHLLLQQAQWAVIHGNSAVYQTSLQQAIDWTQQYFANNEPATQAMLSALARLQKINIQPPIPDISPVLRAFTEALQQNKSPDSTKAEGAQP